MKILKLMKFFADSGWHVVEAKYGHLLQEAFARPGGQHLRRYIDDMSNEEYQSLFAFRGPELRQRFLAGADADVAGFVGGVADDDLAPLVQNLGGHDLQVLADAYRACDAEPDRPSVVFAYTVKGWGLPIAGDPLNHAALLSPAQIDAFRAEVGLTLETEWDRFPADSPEGRLCGSVGGTLNNQPVPARPHLPIPIEVGAITSKAVSTQETFGRLLTALGNHPDVAARLVTTSPDVSVSTNLGGWINKMGVFSPVEQRDFLGVDRLLRWRQEPAGHHLELGISEMNLFLTLHALGLGHELHGEHLLPVGTVYDPFVCRGLDALIYALYNGARFVVVGTPSGISLAPEGGAHQSTITASIGMELPGLTLAEPAYAVALDWLLCDGLARLADPDGDSLYLRLSTRPLDQSPFATARDRAGDEALRADVLAGGYRLVEPANGVPADVVLAASGAVLPEVVAGAARLAEEGCAATVLDLTSADRCYRQWRTALRDAGRDGRAAELETLHVARLLPPADRAAPIVTVHDAASHALAWLGSVFGTRVVPIGVDGFGQSGSVEELYGVFDLQPEQIVNAALVALA
jgi:pyruvate dehydrogenase E1 component